MSEENKLNDQEIRILQFGKTSIGYVFGIKPLEWVLRISDDGEVESAEKEASSPLDAPEQSEVHDDLAR